MDKLADCSTAQTRWLHAERRGGLGSGGLRGWGAGGLGGWGAGVGCGWLLGSGGFETEIGLLENGEVVSWAGRDLVVLKRKLVY